MSVVNYVFGPELSGLLAAILTGFRWIIVSKTPILRAEVVNQLTDLSDAIRSGIFLSYQLYVTKLTLSS